MTGRGGAAPGQTWIVTADEGGMRLDTFLAASTRLASRSRAARALERGQVFVNDRDTSPKDAGRRVAAGDAVRWWADRPGSARTRLRGGFRPDGGLQIIYEDDALIVVNKPAGLLTVPLARRPEAESVLEQLAVHLRPKGRRQAMVVHRIDRDTSGLVVFALNGAALNGLKEQFAQREPERVYLAVVEGVPSPAAGTWLDHLVWDQDRLRQTASTGRDPRSQESRSDYVVRETLAGGAAALIEVRLVTGKRNQIRVQAQRRGHPLVGERQYVTDVDGDDRLPRQALHAWRLTFRHPVSGRVLTFEAPVPRDMAILLSQLRAGALPK